MFCNVFEIVPIKQLQDEPEPTDEDNPMFPGKRRQTRAYITNNQHD